MTAPAAGSTAQFRVKRLMSDQADIGAPPPGAVGADWPHPLTDISDRPFRLRRPPRRKRLLHRLLAPFGRAALRLSRLADSCRTAWTDAREHRGGAKARLLRIFHGARTGGTRAVALYAHFSPHSVISEMVVAQLHDYARLGFRIVFISASPRFDEADFTRIRDIVELAIHRRNFGLDFGGWIDALTLFPDITGQLDELLLVNDSVLGPLHALDPALARMRAAGEGLFGMTDSVQHAPHLQSYFLLARGEAAISDVVSFLRAGRLSVNKRLVVKRFEIALTEHMRDQGHRVAALWGYEELENELLQSEDDVAALFAALPGRHGPAAGPGQRLNLRRQLLDLPLNPIHYFAGMLVRRCAFPFLKTELVLSNPQRIPEAVNWRALVPPESPVPLQAIEDHLSAYERPVRLTARPHVPEPPAAEEQAPEETPPSAPMAEEPAWRHTLASAWARRTETSATHDRQSTVEAGDILACISRFPLVISFSHDDYAAHCGGVQNVVHAEQLGFAAEGLGYLHLSPVATASRLAEPDPSACFSARLDGAVIGTASFETLLEVCRELGRQNAVLASVVHHLSGHAPEQVQALHVAARARELLFWLHDFGTLCESPALLRNDLAFCGGPPETSSACMICAHGAGRQRHLTRLRAFFAAVSPVVLAPSRLALDFWKSRAGFAVELSAVAPPLLLVPLPGPAITRPTRKRLRVAHLGARTFHKGWPVFTELAGRFAADGRFEFLQLGLDEGLPLTPHIRHVPVRVGPGRQSAMADAVVVEEIDIVVNWSSCFETFSFTTHEAIAGGAFVVTHPESGNIWQAIRENAPRQGLLARDEQDLRSLFEGDRLHELLAEAHRSRHVLAVGGAGAEWLLARGADARKRSLRGNG
ncbi:rhamnan synthesis F family protein [Xanthobacter sp. V0B-10]|uniref:rhamnan synthesis F family protein n=1 Tax=Xanthobacter albus TaxID=3119929 RepID=UPI0037299FD0